MVFFSRSTSSSSWWKSLSGGGGSFGSVLLLVGVAAVVVVAVSSSVVNAATSFPPGNLDCRYDGVDYSFVYRHCHGDYHQVTWMGECYAGNFRNSYVRMGQCPDDMPYCHACNSDGVTTRMICSSSDDESAACGQFSTTDDDEGSSFEQDVVVVNCGAGDVAFVADQCRNESQWIYEQGQCQGGMLLGGEDTLASLQLQEDEEDSESTSSSYYSTAEMTQQGMCHELSPWAPFCKDCPDDNGNGGGGASMCVSYLGATCDDMKKSTNTEGDDEEESNMYPSSDFECGMNSEYESATCTSTSEGTMHQFQGFCLNGVKLEASNAMECPEPTAPYCHTCDNIGGYHRICSDNSDQRTACDGFFSSADPVIKEDMDCSNVGTAWIDTRRCFNGTSYVTETRQCEDGQLTGSSTDLWHCDEETYPVCLDCGVGTTFCAARGATCDDVAVGGLAAAPTITSGAARCHPLGRTNTNAIKMIAAAFAALLALGGHMI